MRRGATSRSRSRPPRWHSLVRTCAPGLLAAIVTVYAFTPYIGFMAKTANRGPIVIVRMGAVGAGWLTPDATIQDIPKDAKVGFYTPTIPMTWPILFLDDYHGTRLYIPLWIPAVTLVALMAWVKFAARPRRRGVCPRCGYNLTGCVVTPCDHCGIGTITCPECAARVPQVDLESVYAEDAPTTCATPIEHTPRPQEPAPARSPDPG